MPAHQPLPPQIEQFIHDNPQGVLTSFRKNGMPQLSIVTVYPREGGVGISITETRMKFKNLMRDPRCSVLISHADWWSGFLVFEGKAELTHSGNADPEALRLARRRQPRLRADARSRPDRRAGNAHGAAGRAWGILPPALSPVPRRAHPRQRLVCAFCSTSGTSSGRDPLGQCSQRPVVLPGVDTR